MIRIFLTILTTSLIASMVGCERLDSFKDAASEVERSAAEAEVDDIQALVADYPIFDPEYNFVKYTDSDPEQIQERFPIQTATVPVISMLDTDNEMFAYRVELIRNAQTSIRMQALVYWADETGWYLADELVAAAQRGVDVKVIVDSLSNIGIRTQKMYEYLSDNGVFVGGYGLRHITQRSFMQELEKIFRSVTNVYRRFHEKSFIVDGESPDTATAIIGGANIAKSYFQHVPHEPLRQWMDQEIAIRGDAAYESAKLFDENLENFEEFSSQGLAEVDSGSSSDWSALNELLKRENYLEFFNDPRENPDERVLEEIERQISEPIDLEWRQAITRVVRSRPRVKEYYVKDAYFDLFNTAKRKVEIVNSYFMPSDELIELMQNTVRRGVDVTILTNSPDSSEYRVYGMASRTYFKELLSVNAELAEDNTARLRIYEYGGHRRKQNGIGHLHAKYAIVDNTVVVIGSYNFNKRSERDNSENVILALSPTLASEFSTYFQSQITDAWADPITAEQAENFVQDQSWWDNFIYGTARILRPLL